MTQDRRMSGRMAQAVGARFEEALMLSCAQQQIACTRIPDGCRQLSARKLIRVKSPWDFVATCDDKDFYGPPDIVLLDTKTTGGSKFPNSSIEPNQVREMQCHARYGVNAGYVIWLREPDSVIWVSSKHLEKLIGIKGSIGEQSPEARRLGSVYGKDKFSLRGIFR